MIKLIGVLIMVVGFALKFDAIGTVIISAIATGLVAGMGVPDVLSLLGKTFVANRYMCLFIVILPVVGILERNGLRVMAGRFIGKIKNATPGKVVFLYGLMRTVFAAFNISFGGVAGFVRPIVYPMAAASFESRGIKLDEKDQDEIKGLAAAQENFSWFFGQIMFVAGAGVLLVKGTLDNVGYKIDPVAAVKSEIPVLIMSILVSAVYVFIRDRKLRAKYEKKIDSADEKIGVSN